jgi:hypothetical protein
MASIVIAGNVGPEVKEMVEGLINGKISWGRFFKFLKDNGLETKVTYKKESVKPSAFDEFAGDILSTIFNIPEEEVEDDEETGCEGDCKGCPNNCFHDEDEENIIEDVDGDTKETVAADLFRRLCDIRRIYRRTSYKNEAYKLPFTIKSIVDFMNALDLPTSNIETSINGARKYYFTNKKYTSIDQFKRDMLNEFQIKDIDCSLPNGTPDWIPGLINRVKKQFGIEVKTPSYSEYLFDEILKIYHNWNPFELLAFNELKMKGKSDALEEILKTIKEKRKPNVSKLFAEVMREDHLKDPVMAAISKVAKEDVDKRLKETRKVFEEILNAVDGLNVTVDEIVHYNDLCMKGNLDELKKIRDSKQHESNYKKCLKILGKLKESAVITTVAFSHLYNMMKRATNKDTKFFDDLAGELYEFNSESKKMHIWLNDEGRICFGDEFADPKDALDVVETDSEKKSIDKNASDFKDISKMNTIINNSVCKSLYDKLIKECKPVISAEAMGKIEKLISLSSSENYSKLSFLYDTTKSYKPGTCKIIFFQDNFCVIGPEETKKRSVSKKTSAAKKSKTASAKTEKSENK